MKLEGTTHVAERRGRQNVIPQRVSASGEPVQIRRRPQKPVANNHDIESVSAGSVLPGVSAAISPLTGERI